MQTARKASPRFKERSELLDFLLEVSSVTSETLDLDKLLANVSEIVRRAVDSELIAILLYSEKTRDLRIRHAVGHREEVVRNLAIPIGEGLTGLAATEQQPILVGDVRSDARYLNAVDAVRSELAVPMIARQKLVGVIDLQSTRENAYTEYDRGILRLIASRVAIAIENARLYRRVERQNRTLRTLANISQEISSILEIDELLKKISTTVRSLINHEAFSILLVDRDQQLLRHRFSMRYDQRVKLDNIPLGMGITGAAAVAREPVRVRDTSADPRYIASHPGIRSELAVPLVVHDLVIGVMNLESEREGYFTEDHVRTLSLLAPQIASSIENARLYEEVARRERRLEEDLRAARELQQVLLPAAAPKIDRLEIGMGLRPAREISGDIFDFFQHRGHHAVIAFGDVSGKGAAAALYGAVVNGLLRTLAPRRPKPSDLMRSLNEALLERRVEARYLTLLLALWHPHSRELVIANAGSSPPLVCRKGEFVKVRVEGVPLGLLPDREYEEVTFAAKPGDTIVLYSDGVTDHMNEAGEEYGRGRLRDLIKRECGRPAQIIVDLLLDDLRSYSPSAFDDQTVMVLKVR
jgi:sigma-B regulation protein RsbU (phosphoserine phosphatase)